MGGESSKPETIVETVYAESDESKRERVLSKFKNQLEQMKKEVSNVQLSFQKDVKNTVIRREDSLVMRYSQLKDKAKVEQNIKMIFGDTPLLGMIVDAASRMVEALNTTEEMTQILRWHEETQVKQIGDEIYGLEVHYTVKLLEETKTTYMGLRSSKETVVLIAYKCLAHIMELNPEEYPDEDTLKQIAF